MTDASELELDELLTGLSARQQEFIEARIGTSTDREALDKIQVSRTTLNNWKKTVPEFALAYELCQLERKVVEHREVSNLEDAKEIIRNAMLGAAAHVPEILHELVTLARFASRESDRLKAIDMLLTRLGVDADWTHEKNEEKWLNIMHWVQPKEYSVDVEEGTVEGEFEEAIPDTLGLLDVGSP